VNADFVNLRLLSDGGRLVMVAASGCSSIEIRKRAFEPLELQAVRRMLDSGGHDVVAQSLGIPWIRVEWLPGSGDTVGTLAVGCRTRRRPTVTGIELLAALAAELGERLAEIDRTEDVLTRCALRLARSYEPPDWPSDVDPISRLRPRERGILELYADGLGTDEIAKLLVISQHTVRTHVRNALRTLALHTREEAATVVRADQLAQLL
jgi:DNA-binding CsgD family transcriptional regulator